MSAATIPEPIYAEIRPIADHWQATINDGRETWMVPVTSSEQAQAVCYAAVRGIIRTRRLHAISESCQRSPRPRF